MIKTSLLNILVVGTVMGATDPQTQQPAAVQAPSDAAYRNIDDACSQLNESSARMIARMRAARERHVAYVNGENVQIDNNIATARGLYAEQKAALEKCQNVTEASFNQQKADLAQCATKGLEEITNISQEIDVQQKKFQDTQKKIHDLREAQSDLVLKKKLDAQVQRNGQESAAVKRESQEAVAKAEQVLRNQINVVAKDVLVTQEQRVQFLVPFAADFGLALKEAVNNGTMTEEQARAMTAQFKPQKGWFGKKKKAASAKKEEAPKQDVVKLDKNNQAALFVGLELVHTLQAQANKTGEIKK